MGPRTLVAVALLVASGCSSSDQRDHGPVSTVRGVALASPVCESELASHPCPAAPVPHARVVAVRDGENVARATTDAGGHFVLHLGAGRYVIRLAEVGGYADAGDRTVVIGDNRDVVVRLDVRTVIGG